MRSKVNLIFGSSPEPPRWAIAALVCASLFAEGCGGGGSAVPHPTPISSPILNSKIQHVVIIIQENRTVDNLFNGFPGADTVQRGKTHTGATIPLRQVSLAAPGDRIHTHPAWEVDYNDGGMNGFDVEVPPGKPLAYNYAMTPRSETQPIWDLAARYTFGDQMFQSNTGPSYPAHLYLVAGQSELADENPDRHPWGCDAPRETRVNKIGSNGDDIPGPYPCSEVVSLADVIESRGLSWQYYSPEINRDGGYWSAFQAIGHIRHGPGWANVISPETRIFQTITNGQLANLTWVVPSLKNSDHASSLSTSGPQWVASIVNAIGNSQYWNTTAIFVVWDDWGGWYDHVTPSHLDLMGLGFRVPLIVISPYTKHGYVSHVQHEFGSMLKFTEEQLNLQSLGQTDLRADDLSDCFDFSKPPAPFVPVATSMSQREFINQVPGNRPPDDY